MATKTITTLKKKHHPKFNVPNYGAKSRSRVKPRWRKQRGIDSKKRIKKAYMGAEPTIGYKTPAALIGVRESGKRLFVIHNIMELTSEVKRNTGFAKEYEIAIARGVGKRKGTEIIKMAKSIGTRVTNEGAFK
jgi:large subunit ribosomal protein L32e